MSSRDRSKRPHRWRGSAQQIAVARGAITKWNRHGRHLHPKCGARRKSDGQPCQQLALGNGRCYLHGGRVPSGDGWHRPRWPNKKAPGAMRRFHRKIGDLQRAADKRAKRLARMSAVERQAHEAWHKTHKPGSAKARAADRERRRQDRAARADILRIQIQLAIENGEGVFG